MQKIIVERAIAAPPARVFAAATRFRETRKMMGREATEEMTVTGFDPPRGYVLGAESHGCRYRTELRFEHCEARP